MSTKGSIAFRRRPSVIVWRSFEYSSCFEPKSKSLSMSEDAHSIIYADIYAATLVQCSLMCVIVHCSRNNVMPTVFVALNFNVLLCPWGIPSVIYFRPNCRHRRLLIPGLAFFVVWWVALKSKIHVILQLV